MRFLPSHTTAIDRDLVAKSCGVSAVVTQDPAQPLATLHSAVTATAMSEPADEVRKLLYRVIDLLQPLQSVDVSCLPPVRDAGHVRGVSGIEELRNRDGVVSIWIRNSGSQCQSTRRRRRKDSEKQDPSSASPTGPFCAAAL